MYHSRVVSDTQLQNFLLTLNEQLISIQPAETRVFASSIGYPSSSEGGRRTISLWLVVWKELHARD